jgi:hypothetical protein
MTLMIISRRLRWGLGVVVAAVAVPLASCTFLVSFDERKDVDAGTVVEEDAEPVPLDAPVTPPIDATKPDTAPPGVCAGQLQNHQWGPKNTDRCCRGIARSFDVYSDDKDCNVCGFSCGPGQRCVRSIQGWSFCVGCGNDNTLCGNTHCCANTRTGSNVFSNPADQGQGVCTASDCNGNCGGLCPLDTHCVTDPTTSYYCSY